ncbi:ThiF family adenylyltransferase [Gordonia sputi]|uniref:ThiF family adenylyltransferase n=1 Tax=Gordonia sputi TaxID=36823 RepID=UPI0036AE9E33
MSARFSRQTSLIDADHQVALRGATVAVAGLGVGAAVVQQAALLGVGGLRFCDGDALAVHNLNRHPLGTGSSIGCAKTEVVARYCLDLDPELRLEVVGPLDAARGCGDFVRGASVVVDEVDDVDAKWALRSAAEWHGVPLLMATDLGDGVLLDCERYDLDVDTLPFHGLTAPTLPVPEQLSRLFGAYCGERFWAAVSKRGPHDPFPQLGATVALAGAVTAVAVREIVGGHGFPTGRYLYRLGVAGAEVVE